MKTTLFRLIIILTFSFFAVSASGEPDDTSDDNDFGYMVGYDCNPTISGRLFYDFNQLTDNTVNGLNIIPSGINAVLVQVNADTTEVVVDSAEIPTTDEANVGEYSFIGGCSQTYYVMLANTGTFTVGNPPPADSSLPVNPDKDLRLCYISVGENIGAGPGSDGTVDGKSAVFGPIYGNLVEVNFGIIRFCGSITID